MGFSHAFFLLHPFFISFCFLWFSLYLSIFLFQSPIPVPDSLLTSSPDALDRLISWTRIKLSTSTSSTHAPNKQKDEKKALTASPSLISHSVESPSFSQSFFQSNSAETMSVNKNNKSSSFQSPSPSNQFEPSQLQLSESENLISQDEEPLTTSQTSPSLSSSAHTAPCAPSPSSSPVLSISAPHPVASRMPSNPLTHTASLSAPSSANPDMDGDSDVSLLVPVPAASVPPSQAATLSPSWPLPKLSSEYSFFHSACFAYRAFSFVRSNNDQSSLSCFLSSDMILVACIDGSIHAFRSATGLLPSFLLFFSLSSHLFHPSPFSPGESRWVFSSGSPLLASFQTFLEKEASGCFTPTSSESSSSFSEKNEEDLHSSRPSTSSVIPAVDGSIFVFSDRLEVCSCTRFYSLY